MTRAALLLAAALAGCASSPTTPRAEPDPAAEEREIAAREAEAKRRDFRAVLVRLDQAIDSYVNALANRGEPRADKQAEQLFRSIRDTVLDQGPIVYGKDAHTPPPGANYNLLQAAAIDGSAPADQGIALAALGFSGVASVMPTILAGAQLADPFLIDRAVLGLAVLRSPDTPPGVIARIAENPTHPEDGRVQAAWALYQLQGAVSDQAPYVAIWRRFLTEKRDDLPPGVLLSAIRGLGFARDAANSDLAAAFLTHPVPRLRMASCIALARMNAQDRAGELIELLGPRESVQNVRLHARKALADLAGGTDHGYDVAAWRKTFDRGR